LARKKILQQGEESFFDRGGKRHQKGIRYQIAIISGCTVPLLNGPAWTVPYDLSYLSSDLIYLVTRMPYLALALLIEAFISVSEKEIAMQYPTRELRVDF
jgi:hypothetical protein